MYLDYKVKIKVDHWHILSLHLRSQKELLIGGVKEIIVRVEVENKAQDAAYPGKVIVMYPSVIDYVSSQVGRCEERFNIALVRRFSKRRHSKSFRGVPEGFYEVINPASSCL